MARRNDGLLDLVAQLPWQAGVGLSVLAYAALRFGLPLVDVDNPTLKVLAQGGIALAPLIAGLVLFAALLSFIGRWKRARLLDGQSGIETIRALSWQQFEQLVGEYYRRQNYTVEEVGQRGADGGVDLRLRRDGELILVQCKQWRTWKVGVGVVREMLGSMTSFGAVAGVVVTSGRYTAEAHRLARDHGIELVNGDRLVEMISTVREQPGVQAPLHSSDNIVKRCSSSIGRSILLHAVVPLICVVGVVVGLFLLWHVATSSIKHITTDAIERAGPATTPSATPTPRLLDGRIYRWRDVDGEVVYGDRPPAHVDAIEVEGRLQDANVIRGY